MPKYLHFDYETFSDVDIKKSGMYKYVESPNFEGLLLAYCFDDEPIEVVDLTTHTPAPAFLAALTDPEIYKVAHNAAFERAVTLRLYDIDIPAEQTICTAVLSQFCGLPASLADVGKALNLTQQKDTAGKALIRYFCVPRKPTKSNPSTRNYPVDNSEKWSAFKEYCRQDVATECDIFRTLLPYLDEYKEQLPLYALDSSINRRGVPIDLPFVHNQMSISDRSSDIATEKMIALTGLHNPNSVPQLKKWVESQTSESLPNLDKDTVATLLSGKLDSEVREVLLLKQLTSKSSVKKYEAMTASACSDSRVRGSMQFYAARTGRWAGRIIQPQNLPQTHIKQLDEVRTDFSFFDYETLVGMYDNVPSLLSQLIRTAIHADPGKMLISADYSAIEARVIAWLAGEQWRLDVFKTHGKIYEASAAMMYKIPIESIAKDSPERQKGKVAELALGYEGGVGAMEKMGGEKMGLSMAEMKDIVREWRKASPAIVALWADLEESAVRCLIKRKSIAAKCGIVFHRTADTLAMELPSGRKLHYWKPTLSPSSRSRTSYKLNFMGVESVSKKFMKLETYGGKLTENAVQAISRDIIADALLRLDAAGYETIFHVHDEIVLEVNEEIADFDLSITCSMMGVAPKWAAGLPLRAEGYISQYYKKD